ncbi:hypothetical protein ACS0TY_012768 [Phlomoides rotata]
MSSITRLILIIFLSLLSFTLPSTANPLTVYEALQSYDFSVGLIPKGVTSNELDPSTGKFIVKLNGTCSFDIDGYALKYKSTISGTISKDKIKDLKGIQVKVLFFWVNIVEVTRDKDVTLLVTDLIQFLNLFPYSPNSHSGPHGTTGADASGCVRV